MFGAVLSWRMSGRGSTVQGHERGVSTVTCALCKGLSWRYGWT